MEIKFVCPRSNEVQTEAVCEKMYEYEACMGCTSQRDEARKALSERLQTEYGNRADITMTQDGILITVRNDLRILADPGDWRDTLVEIDCGEYGDTHCHPKDVHEWVADFMEGRQVIMFNEDGMCSGNTHPDWFKKYHPEDLHKWSRIMDIHGTYTSKEYAEKYLGKSVDEAYHFYCPKLQRDVNTDECYDRGNTGRACYGECCDHIEGAICGMAADQLRERFGNQLALKWREEEGLLSIRFHDGLTLEAYYDRLFRTMGFDAYLHGVHGHDFPAEDVDGLVRIVGALLEGKMAFVVRHAALFIGGSLQLVCQEELQAKWRRYTRGKRTRIVDGKGSYLKTEYLQQYPGSM